MPQVKSPSESAAKWASRAAVSGDDYKKGVQNPRRDWASATSDAAEAHAQGVQEAIADGRFARGVNNAGTSKWQRKAISVGSSRYAPGVNAAKSDYEAGFTPYANVIQGVSLPPRGPKGDPRNYERTKIIGEALHEAKTAGA